MPQVYQKIVTFLFLLTVFAFSLWSWVLVDPNFTLIKHADWTLFREYAIQIGYLNRGLSSQIYMTLILTLTLLSTVLIFRPPKNIVFLALCIGFIAGILSYPALSHDLFNYIFDARIITHYGQNPYLHKALDFPSDPMLRFMHWTHREYPYGPSYLLLSLIPSFFGMGKFALTFLLFKASHVVLFVLTAYVLTKMNKMAAIIFVSSPLIIIEGLVNTHNDFVALTLAIIGIYFVKNSKNWWALFALLLSGCIKYFTLPAVLVGYQAKHSKYMIFAKWKVLLFDMQTLLAFFGTLLLIIYLSIFGEIQPWYFLNLFVFLPFYQKIFIYFLPFFTGLLLSYCPYVSGGQWGQGGDVIQKKQIIAWSLAVSLVLVSFIMLQQWLRNKCHTSAGLV